MDSSDTARPGARDPRADTESVGSHWSDGKLTLPQKLEKRWAKQGVPASAFAAMHARVDTIVAAATELSTTFGACVTLRMFNETLVEARPPGPFRIAWKTAEAPAEPPRNTRDDLYTQLAMARGRMGPAADGVFDDAVKAHGLCVLEDRQVAVCTGSWGRSQFYTALGQLLPLHIRSADP